MSWRAWHEEYELAAKNAENFMKEGNSKAAGECYLKGCKAELMALISLDVKEKPRTARITMASAAACLDKSLALLEKK